MEWKSFAGLKHGTRAVPRVDDLERLAGVLDVPSGFVFQVAAGAPAREIAALLIRETRLRAVLDRLADAVFTLDPAGRIQDMNERLCAIVGRDRAALYGHRFADLLVPADARRAACSLAPDADAGAMRGAEVVLVRPGDGEHRILELDATRIEDPPGAPLGVQVVARDITARRRLELDLEGERRTLQLIFDNVPAACILFERDGTIARANALVEACCPAAAHEMIGRSATAVFGDPGPAGCPVTRAFQTGRAEQQISLVRNRAGERVYVHRTAGPIVRAGQVDKVIEILVDVTPQLRRGDLRLLDLWSAQPPEDEASGPARRRAPRIAADLVVELCHDGRRFAGHVENLSAEGMFVRVPEPIPVGQEIELAWDLPGDGVAVAARGVVVWRRDGAAAPPGMGVRLIEIARRARGH